MKIAAIIVGILFLVAIGFIVASWLWLKRVARKSFAAVPARISVVHEPSAEWKNVEQRDRAFEELKAMRFIPAGTFRIPELTALVAGFIREEDRLLAVVFEHPAAGLWADVCIEYEDGGTLTVSNAPHGAEMDTMPGHRKIIQKDLNVVEMVRLIDDERGSGRTRAIASSGFAATLCEAYARDYDWRMNRGGTTVQETLRVMDKMEQEQLPALPCRSGECPYEYDKGSEREIEGMPFPRKCDDPRACPTYGHLCPQFMQELGLTVEDLQIRATIHCGALADTLVEQGKLSTDSEQYKMLVAKFDEVKRTYPIEDYPQYYR